MIAGAVPKTATQIYRAQEKSGSPLHSLHKKPTAFLDGLGVSHLYICNPV